MKQRARRPANPGARPLGCSSINCVKRWPGSGRHVAYMPRPIRAKCVRSSPHQPTHRKAERYPGIHLRGRGLRPRSNRCNLASFASDYPSGWPGALMAVRQRRKIVEVHSARGIRQASALACEANIRVADRARWHQAARERLVVEPQIPPHRDDQTGPLPSE